MDDDNSHNEYNDKNNDDDVNRKNSLAFVKTYKRLSKRGSAYKLFNFNISEKNIKKEKSFESSNSSELSSSSNSTKKKIKKKFILIQFLIILMIIRIKIYIYKKNIFCL